MLSYKGVLFYTIQRNNRHYWYLVGTYWLGGRVGHNTRTIARQCARIAIEHYASINGLSVDDMQAYKHAASKG